MSREQPREFTGPYRDLLARIYQRCLTIGWFGPEVDSPEEIAWRYPPQDYEYKRFQRDDRHYCFAYPPATDEQIAQTEEQIGFALPPLLKDLYQQLANGGFGFYLGFVGVAGGDESENGDTIEKGTIHTTWRLSEVAPDGLIGLRKVFKCMELPDRFIPWAGWGCGIESWIDGWSGRIYQVGTWELDDSISDMPLEEGEGIRADEQLLSPPPSGSDLADDIPLEEQDFAQVEMTEWDVEDSNEEESYCYGLFFEAHSLEEWLEKWLRDELIQYS